MVQLSHPITSLACSLIKDRQYPHESMLTRNVRAGKILYMARGLSQLMSARIPFVPLHFVVLCVGSSLRIQTGLCFVLLSIFLFPDKIGITKCTANSIVGSACQTEMRGFFYLRDFLRDIELYHIRLSACEPEYQFIDFHRTIFQQRVDG